MKFLRNFALQTEKESACNAGDLGLIPGSGRSPGEGKGYPLQYPCLENPTDRGAWYSSQGRKESDTTERLHFHFDPLQYSWASLEAHLVKNLPIMWETWVQSLGWEDTLEKRKATHSSILAWRIPWTV